MKTLAVLGLALTACTSNGSSGSEFGEAAAAVEGIYSVQTFTWNEASCSPGGDSILANERFAVVFTSEAFGHEYAQILSCESADDCRAKVALIKAREGFAVDFSFVVDQVEGDALLGRGANSGFHEGDVCTEGEVDATTLTLDGDALRLEREITLAADYPIDADDFCSTDAAQEAAEGASCSQLEVLTATYLSPL